MVEVRVPDEMLARYGVSGAKEMIAMWAHEEGIAVDFKDTMALDSEPLTTMMLDFRVYGLFQSEKDAVHFKLRWC